MKLADPSIQVTCSGAHGPNAAMDPYLFQAAGKHLDLISVHEYWIPNYQRHQTPDYLTCMMLAEKPDVHLLTAIRSLDGGGVRGRMKIAFDEWNLRSWHHPGFSGHRPRKVDDADPAVAALIKARGKSDDASLYTMADAVDCRVLVNRTPLEGAFTATVLAGDSADAHNDVEHPDRVKPEETKVSLSNGIVRLPPHSLTIMRNRPAGASGR